jgi:hypothetical protein
MPAEQRSSEMRFMVSLIFDESQMDEVTRQQMEETAAEMNEYNDELREAGVMQAGEGLAPSGMARTLRWGEAGKPVATDGPFAESKEQLGGFWIIECGDLDKAVEWAGKAPIRNGALEVRPIVESAEEARELHQRQAGS